MAHHLCHNPSYEFAWKTREHWSVWPARQVRTPRCGSHGNSARGGRIKLRTGDVPWRGTIAYLTAKKVPRQARLFWASDRRRRKVHDAGVHDIRTRVCGWFIRGGITCNGEAASTEHDECANTDLGQTLRQVLEIASAKAMMAADWHNAPPSAFCILLTSTPSRTSPECGAICSLILGCRINQKEGGECIGWLLLAFQTRVASPRSPHHATVGQLGQVPKTTDSLRPLVPNVPSL